jgi:hypothetical protein
MLVPRPSDKEAVLTARRHNLANNTAKDLPLIRGRVQGEGSAKYCSGYATKVSPTPNAVPCRSDAEPRGYPWWRDPFGSADAAHRQSTS